MSIYFYWMIGELTIIVFVFSLIIIKLWRTAKAKEKAGKPKLPETLQGKISHYTKYVLRLLGFGLGVLLVLSVFITIERTLLSVFMETAPAPSEVTSPPDLGFDVEEVTFESEDGITLAGWFTPSQNGATIILLHGYGGNRTGMLWHARQLVNAGYGVLMYDERASGESTGEYRSYGWEDTRDVKTAIQFLNSRKADENIGTAGCSTGADIAVYSAALYPEIDAVWGDGNSPVRAQDLPAPKDPLMAVIISSNYLIDWLYTVKLNIEAPTPMIDVLPNIAPRPIVFVGGGRERPIVGSEADLFTRRFAEIAGPNAEAWVIDEATHCNGPVVIAEEYSTRMVQFFDTAFGIPR
ncbi:MAG: alpha/beta hydrolase [Anaerolineales bacterium]|jgi:pimeloyl-ACP methyl ester carboxylesterase|nr:alpha/beta hydrolase [Anaerolineales bacterium]